VNRSSLKQSCKVNALVIKTEVFIICALIQLIPSQTEVFGDTSRVPSTAAAEATAAGELSKHLIPNTEVT
jgi:hypothetical protein